MHSFAMLQGFESNALGSFGGGAESTEAWRKRVDAQDALSAAAAAKSAALHRKEEALLARRATLAQLEAAVNAVTAEEALASAAAAAAQAALGDLEAHAQVFYMSRGALHVLSCSASPQSSYAGTGYGLQTCYASACSSPEC